MAEHRLLVVAAGLALVVALLLIRGIPYLTQQREVIRMLKLEDCSVAESEFDASPHRGRVSVYGVAMQESLRTS